MINRHHFLPATALLLLLILTTILLTGCSSNAIVGTWEHSEFGATATFTFNANGTGTCTCTTDFLGYSEKETFKYKIDQNKITLIYESRGGESCIFSVKGNQLTITSNGNSLDFIRK